MTDFALPKLNFGIKRLLVAAALIALAVPSLPAQAGAATTPASSMPANAPYVATMTFDVASVRESKPDPNGWITVRGEFTPHTGTVRLENNSVLNLVMWAYPVDGHQIEGIPRAMGWSMFNIEAKADPVTDEKLAKLDETQQRLEQRHMMQVLLEERFKLKAHWETRDAPTYDLVLAKGGRLKSTGAPPSAEEIAAWGDRLPPLHQQGSSMRGFEYIAHGATSADIAKMLTGQFGRPVADKTGLTGKYDFDLKTYQTRSSDRKEDETNPWPPLETAIQDQLGLKLVVSHGPVQTLVIDHIEKPSEN